MATTIQSLIERSLQKLLCEEDVDNFSADQLAHGLEAVQDMLDSWSLDPFKQFELTLSNFNTANATASYTIGAAQTWNTSQPIDIDQAFIRVSNEDYQVEVVKRREFNKIPDKAKTGRPTKLYFQRGASTGTVYLWPVPTATEAIYLDMRKALATFSALANEVTLPLGYRRAIVFNLAVEIAPDYEIEPSAEINRMAAESLAAIMQINSPHTMAGFNPNGPRDRGLVLDKEKG